MDTSNIRPTPEETYALELANFGPGKSPLADRLPPSFVPVGRRTDAPGMSCTLQ